MAGAVAGGGGVHVKVDEVVYCSQVVMEGTIRVVGLGT